MTAGSSKPRGAPAESVRLADQSTAAHTNVGPAEVCHEGESAAGRKVPGYRASQPGRGPDETVQPDARLSHGAGLFARLLLTERCSPVGQLRAAPATATRA